MTRLSFVRPGDDGDHLVLATESGEQFELELTDDLRRAVATVRPRRTEEQSEPGAATMSPKEIQQRIRGGLNAAELAELTGQPYALLERYEGPVLAERSYIADLARGTRIGRESDSPVLGDLVTDRLAGRGVDPESVAWDAWREIDEPWMVAADYRVDGRKVRAQWAFDHTARAVTALDDESRWLSETELLDVPIPKRHLSAVREVKDEAAPLDQVRPAMPAPLETEPTQTELLLEDLDTRRGTRDSVEPEDLDDHDDDGGFEGFGPAVQRQRQADVGFNSPPAGSMGHPAGSARRSSGSDASAPSAASAPEASETPAPERKSTKRGRSSVPSWDEIVFGAKND